MKDSGVIYEDPYVQVGCSLIGELLGNLLLQERNEVDF